MRSLENACHTLGVFTMRRYTNPRLPYLTLPYRSVLVLDQINLPLCLPCSVVPRSRWDRVLGKSGKVNHTRTVFAQCDPGDGLMAAWSKRARVISLTARVRFIRPTTAHPWLHRAMLISATAPGF